MEPEECVRERIGECRQLKKWLEKDRIGGHKFETTSDRKVTKRDEDVISRIEREREREGRIE